MRSRLGSVYRNMVCDMQSGTDLAAPSTYFSCRRRSPGGELLAEDGQVAEMDQLPGVALQFCEQAPSRQVVRLDTVG